MDVNSNICKKGIVQNCKIFENNTPYLCQECQEGYAKLLSTIDVCYPIDASLKCKRTKDLTTDFVCIECKHSNQILFNLEFFDQE